MSDPTPADVASFLGQSDDASVVALAGQSLPLVKALAMSYTRGKGFTDGTPADDIAAVLVVATARMVANPEQVETHAGEVVTKGGFSGWTLAELFVLNRYRKRASG